MLPVFVIVGRPNVGKSTLFNYLTKSKAALVADFPGVTRDRQYGEAEIDGRNIIVVDTGGMVDKDSSEIAVLSMQQTKEAIKEADLILFVVAADEGLTVEDEAIFHSLRSFKPKIRLVVNKADHQEIEEARADFFAWGIPNPQVISAKRGRGIKAMMRVLLQEFPKEESAAKISGTKIAVIGRPNVGKSTLVNALLGQERVIVADFPGTTRESIYISFERKGCPYVLIDTAGVRRKSKIHAAIEKFSVIKSLQAIQESDVVIMVLNAKEGIVDQDLTLLGLIIESGRGLLIALNQWDHLEKSQEKDFKLASATRLKFASFAKHFYISALYRRGIGKLFSGINQVYRSLHRPLATADLTKLLGEAVKVHEPPLVKGRRIKLRYAHLGGHFPLTLIIHGKQVVGLPLSYKRFLTHFFIQKLRLVGVPLRLEFKQDVNPYIK